MIAANTDLIKALCNYLWNKIPNFDLSQNYKKINLMIKNLDSIPWLKFIFFNFQQVLSNMSP